MRRERERDRGRMMRRRGLERLRADQHADVEQDRRDRDQRDQRQHQRDDAEPGQHDHHDPGRGRIADPSAHRLPAGMADIDRVDEGIAHQAADQADDAVRGQHLRGREVVAGGFRALHVVHGFDQIVDAERNRGDEDDAEEFETREHVAECRYRHREAEMSERAGHLLEAHAAEIEAEQGRAPGDQHAGRDRDQSGRNALGISHAAEPAHQDDGKADQTDLRRQEHFQRRPHRDEGDRHTGERTEQRSARRDLADIRRDEAADHQDEALEEHPDEARFPALDRIVGLERDRQHDHEGDHEHVRHADARRQRADIGAAGLQRQFVGEPRVIHRGQEHHQAHRGQDASEHDRVRHFQHEAQQPGQHQHVDQDVGAETEKRVPVARRPQRGTEFLSAGIGQTGHRTPPSMIPNGIFGARAPCAAIAAIAFCESETQPKIPPCALIMARPAAWKSGK